MASLEKTPYKIEVGKRIRRARLSIGKKPIEVYSPLGVASGKYSQWENGWALPRLEEAVLLVGALETSMDYIFRAIGAPKFRAVESSRGKESRKTPRTHNVRMGSEPVPSKAPSKSPI